MFEKFEKSLICQWRVSIVWCVIIAAHFASVIYHFPIRHAFGNQSLASGDSSITLGKAWDASRCEESGSAVGYSPSYMAGYHCGSWNSVGHRSYELGTTYLPFGSPATRYYWTVVGMASILPILIGLASRGCGYTWRTTLCCTGFGAIIIQLCDPVSYFWTFGNAAFPFCSVIAVAAVSFALPAGSIITYRRAAFSGLLGGLAIWAHTIAVIPLFCGGLAAVVIALRDHNPLFRLAGLISTTLGVILLIVLPGHIHLFSNLDERSPMVIEPLKSGIKYLIFDILSDRAYRHPLDRRPLFHVLLAFSTWQAWNDWRERVGRSEGLWLAGIFTLALGYACGHLPVLKQLQPYRFVVSGDLFLVIPAYHGLCRLYTYVKAATPPSRTSLIVLGVAFAPSLLGYGLDSINRERATSLSPEAIECVDWIQSQPKDGRVLCEPGDLGSLLPHLTNREVIGGGVSSQAVVIQGWSHVGDGRAFGRPIGEVTPGEFLKVCRLLDIRIFIVDSERLEKLLLVLPTKVKKESEFGRLRVYSIEPSPSATIWEGCYQGKVTVTHNRIQIKDPPVGKITINYHYVDGFQSQAGIEVRPVNLPGVPAPFIEIISPEPRQWIELTFRSRPR